MKNTASDIAEVTASVEPDLSKNPLWESTLATMRKNGIDYGSVYEVEWLETHLDAKRDSVGFGLAIAAIRRALEHDGYYLTAKGQAGTGFVILAANLNASVLETYQKAAIDALRRGVILGTNTRLDSLNEDERRRHEASLARIAQRAALVSRKLPSELPSTRKKR